MNNTGEKRNPKRRVCLALFSDTHGGDEHGLISPDTQWQLITKDGSPYLFSPNLTPIQEFLYALYTNCIDRCNTIARRDELIPMHGGDFVAGEKHDGVETMVAGFSRQKAVALANMLPWFQLKNVKRIRLTEGTEAHDYEGLGMVYELASHLRDKFPKIDIGVVQHGLIDIDGFTIDYAHHGPSVGKYTWTKGNVARSYIRDLMIREILAGRRPPDLVWRAHYHDPIVEEMHLNGYKSTIVITPSFAFPGAWTRKATGSAYDIYNGMMLVEIVNGKLIDIHEYIERTDTRTKETI